jgi:TetR/AcrR family transcriptional regulator, transcriptional repressor for nem operon
LERKFRNRAYFYGTMPRTKAFDEKVALEKAMLVFWKEGYHAASMEMLVEAMGISRSSFYDTFGDKKQLYLAALRLFQSQSQQQNAKTLAQSGPSPKAQITAVLQFSLEEALNDPDTKGCMMANATAEMATADADVYKFLKENACALESFFTQLIQLGQEIGQFNPAFDSATAANYLVNYIHGMRLVCKTKPDPQKMRQGLELVLAGLCK